MKLLGEGRYRRADTSQEKLRRMKLGLRDAVVLSAVYLPPVAFVSDRYVRPTRLADAILTLLLIGPPILLGVIGEIRSGRAYDREVESTTKDGPHVQ